MPIPGSQQIHIEIGMHAFAVPAGGRQIPITNVYKYRRTTTVNPLVKSHVESAFQAQLGALILAAMNVRYTQTYTTIRIMNDATDAPLYFVEAGVGAIATDSYDSRSAIMMTLETGLKGRRYRGSKHYGPLSEADTTGDILTGAGLARWQAVQAGVLAGFTDSDSNVWIPCIVSGKPLSQLLVNPTTIIANDIIHVGLNKQVGQMKRRRSGSVYV